MHLRTHLRRKRVLTVMAVAAVVLVSLYYSRGQKGDGSEGADASAAAADRQRQDGGAANAIQDGQRQGQGAAQCKPIRRTEADIETAQVLPKLNFNPDWLEQREYWNERMEKRYLHRRNKLWSKIPLKVFVMPHSHNDPGWLKTYEMYFHTATNAILNNAVDKLTKYKNMTFVWTEMSFLSMWYEKAHDARKANLQQLVDEGRFEILTGGWVMTDEANAHIYAMVDQLIEGQQWLKSALGVTPNTSWSVDPFGHGATFPYVLRSAGVDATLIMRIHYAWKEYFAIEQTGDFMWKQAWDEAGKHNILCHNFPYDIYSIKGSCGPNAMTCLEFNFGNIPGIYTESSARHTPVNAANVRERSEVLLEQYGKTGSLFPHNVVIVPLGDDFAYSHEVELDQQYANYKQMMDYINSNASYNAEVRFGTLSDYFREVRKRTSKFDTLTGDFFVYSDVFSEGRPAYWSGYYTTRPYMKQLSRELEHTLRSAEILFTLSRNSAVQRDHKTEAAYLDNLFPKLVAARRDLALFMHHDAITGTSKQFVMHDYGTKLMRALMNSKDVQKGAMQYLTVTDDYRSSAVREGTGSNVLHEDLVRADFTQLPVPVALELKKVGSKGFVEVFNSLAQDRREPISVFVEHSDVCVTDAATGRTLGKDVVQINPTWSPSRKLALDKAFWELVFLADLPALSISKFILSRCQSKNMEKTKVFCLNCKNAQEKDSSPFEVSPLPGGAIQLENSNLALVFDEHTRLLSTVTEKATGTVQEVEVYFAGYPTTPFKSGAYLLKPDEDQKDYVKVFDPFRDLKEVAVVSGPVYSEVSVFYSTRERNTSSPAPNMNVAPPPPPNKDAVGTLLHSVRVYHAGKHSTKSMGVYMENALKFADGDSNREHIDIDFFMRLRTSVKNLDSAGLPVYFTDSNGFQMLRRVKVREIGIEGNYYPITTAAYIEDDSSRLGLVVDHAQAAISLGGGDLEVMLDRKSAFDDGRGMGEGVLDNRHTVHKYWLLVEPRTKTASEGAAQHESHPPQLSALALALSRSLNYPPVQFVGHEVSALRDSVTRLLKAPLLCDTHLFNLRTIPEDAASPVFEAKPSSQALLILHKHSSDCDFAASPFSPSECVAATARPTVAGLGLDVGLNVKHVVATTLTGTRDLDDANQQIGLDQLEPEPMTLAAARIQF